MKHILIASAAIASLLTTNALAADLAPRPYTKAAGILTPKYKLEWFGTARGRVGFLRTERVLLYAAGGLAYGPLSATAPLIPLSWGSTRAGWTVGAGAEAAIDRNWSVKLEYLYMDLGNVGSSGATATTVVNQPNTPGIGFNTVPTTTPTSAFRPKFTS